MLKLHLGCGANIMPGWQNLDCTQGREGVTYWHCPEVSLEGLYGAGGADYLYSEHFVEHIELGEFEALLSDAHAVLKSGGVFRISTPDLEEIAQTYLRKAWDYSAVGWYPPSPCDFINGAMRLWEHKYLYDYDKLHDCARAAGFAQVNLVHFKESLYPELEGLECRPDYQDLIVELIKY